MRTIFFSAMEQMIVLFLLMAVGYFLQKKNLAGENASKVLSNLEVNIFSPCLTLVTFTRNFSLDVLVEKLSLMGLSVVILLLFTIPFSRILSKRIGRSQKERAVYSYSLCFSNAGYLGAPIIRAVFGEEALMNMLIFCFPIDLAISSYGMYTLLPENKHSLKTLLKPITVAPVIAVTLIAMNIELPEILKTVLQSCANCMAPVAMILTGIVLGRQPLKGILSNGRAYIASSLRLIVIPLLVASVLYILDIRGEMLIIAASVLAMPLGLNSVIFAEAFGGDATSGSQATFISNVLGMFTIPVMLSVFYVMA